MPLPPPKNFWSQEEALFWGPEEALFTAPEEGFFGGPEEAFFWSTGHIPVISQNHPGHPRDIIQGIPGI